MIYRVQWYDSIIPESNLRKMFPDLLKEYELKHNIKPCRKEKSIKPKPNKSTESSKRTLGSQSSSCQSSSRPSSAKEALAKKLLQKHKKASREPKNFPCNFCEKKFKTSIDLKCHIYIHQFAGKTKNRIILPKPGEEVEKDCPPLDSAKASKLKEKSKVKRTRTKMERTKCEICGKEVTVKRLESHKIIYHLKTGKFPCSVCGKRFMYERDLQRHIKIHDDGQLEKATCDICGKVLTKKHLENHKNRFHSQGEYTCKKCNKVFTHILDLDWHLQKTCTQTANSEPINTGNTETNN